MYGIMSALPLPVLPLPLSLPLVVVWELWGKGWRGSPGRGRGKGGEASLVGKGWISGGVALLPWGIQTHVPPSPPPLTS